MRMLISFLASSILAYPQQTYPREGRIDCGHVGTTEADCTNSGCIWSPLENGSAEPWCFQRVLPREGRLDCGGNSPQQCASLGCTWAPLEQGSVEPWCFRPVPPEPRAGRLECGYAGIQQAECVGKGCTWSPLEVNSKEPWCFRPTPPEPREGRLECGYAGIQQAECVGKGCTWSPLEDNSKEPWCFRPTPPLPREGRRDCGYTGITDVQCEAKGCIWSPLEDNSKEPWCVKPTYPREGRLECGQVGTTEADCTNNGCYWSPLEQNSKEPWCFRPVPSLPREGRVDCGFVGINNAQCEAKGCIWSPLENNSKEPWCVRPNFPRENRIDCGHAGTTEAECNANGCYWSPLEQNSKEPWCFKLGGLTCVKDSDCVDGTVCVLGRASVGQCGNDDSGNEIELAVDQVPSNTRRLLIEDLAYTKNGSKSAPEVRLANVLAPLANDAYNSPPSANVGKFVPIVGPLVGNQAGKWPWLGVTVYRNPDSRRLAIAFKGSQTFNDFATDLTGTLSKCDIIAGTYNAASPCGNVHTGFLTAYKTLRDKLFPQIQSSLLSPGITEVYVTGHSLGGALAVLCAAELASKGIKLVGVATFGTPRIGDKDFETYYDALMNSKQVLNARFAAVDSRVKAQDAVTMLAPIIPDYVPLLPHYSRPVKSVIVAESPACPKLSPIGVCETLLHFMEPSYIPMISDLYKKLE